MRKTLLAVCAAALGGGLVPAQAQTLQMTEPAAAQVEASYGAPSDKIAAVGQPPISRWVYPGFTVYFEYDHVVHAVLTPGGP